MAGSRARAGPSRGARGAPDRPGRGSGDGGRARALPRAALAADRPLPRRADEGGDRRARAGPASSTSGVVNGGVWKTTDYGRTWKPIFDDQPTGSIGALAVAPSNPDVIYVGSGEGMQRPDLSTGDGIYKSTDGGTTWTPPRPPRRPADPADRRGPAATRAGSSSPCSATRTGPTRSAGSSARPTAGETLREGPLPGREHGRRRRRPRPAPIPTPSTPCSGRRARGPGRTASSPARAAGSSSPRMAAAAGGRSRAGLPTFAEGLGPDRDHGRAERPAAALRHGRGAGRGGDLPLGRRGRELAASSTPTRGCVARPERRGRGAGPPEGPRHRVRPHDRRLEVHGRREDLHRLPRRARRRRLPADLDRPRPPGGDDPGLGPGRDRDRERRRDAGAAGTTSRPRSSTTSAPTTRSPTASAAGSRRAARPACRAAATTGRSPSASGTRSGSRSTATSRPTRSTPTSSTAARSAATTGAPGRRRTSRRDPLRGAGVPRRPHPAARLLARSTRRSSTSPRTRSGRRRTAASAGRRSAPTSPERPGRCPTSVGKYRGDAGRRGDPARRHLHGRALRLSTPPSSGRAPTTGSST